VTITYDAQEEAQNCAEYDLRPQMARKGMALRNFQGESGWCYAFVAADLLSFKLGAKVSAADIAINSINTRPEMMLRSTSMAQTFPIGGGFPSFALNDLNGRGVCLDADFPIDLSKPELTSQIVTGRDGRPQKLPVPEIVLDYEKVSQFFPDERIKNLLRGIRQNSFRQALNELPENSCTPQFRNLNIRAGYYTWKPTTQEINTTDSVRLKELTDERRVDFGTRVNAFLNAKKIFALSYDTSVHSGSTLRARTVENPTDSHTASVVGSRFNRQKGRCEVLVRNSESNCSAYSTDFECRDNHYWIPKKLMLIGSGAIYSIED
jgi:hypothetical protein